MMDSQNQTHHIQKTMVQPKVLSTQKNQTPQSSRTQHSTYLQNQQHKQQSTTMRPAAPNTIASTSNNFAASSSSYASQGVQAAQLTPLPVSSSSLIQSIQTDRVPKPEKSKILHVLAASKKRLRPSELSVPTHSPSIVPTPGTSNVPACSIYSVIESRSSTTEDPASTGSTASFPFANYRSNTVRKESVPSIVTPKATTSRNVNSQINTDLALINLLKGAQKNIITQDRETIFNSDFFGGARSGHSSLLSYNQYLSKKIQIQNSLCQSQPTPSTSSGVKSLHSKHFFQDYEKLSQMHQVIQSTLPTDATPSIGEASTTQALCTGATPGRSFFKVTPQRAPLAPPRPIPIVRKSNSVTGCSSLNSNSESTSRCSSEGQNTINLEITTSLDNKNNSKNSDVLSTTVTGPSEILPVNATLSSLSPHPPSVTSSTSKPLSQDLTAPVISDVSHLPSVISSAASKSNFSSLTQSHHLEVSAERATTANKDTDKFANSNSSSISESRNRFVEIKSVSLSSQTPHLHRYPPTTRICGDSSKNYSLTLNSSFPVTVSTNQSNLIESTPRPNQGEILPKAPNSIQNLRLAIATQTPRPVVISKVAPSSLLASPVSKISDSSPIPTSVFKSSVHTPGHPSQLTTKVSKNEEKILPNQAAQVDSVTKMSESTISLNSEESCLGNQTTAVEKSKCVSKSAYELPLRSEIAKNEPSQSIKSNVQPILQNQISSTVSQDSNQIRTEGKITMQSSIQGDKFINIQDQGFLGEGTTPAQSPAESQVTMQRSHVQLPDQGHFKLAQVEAQSNSGNKTLADVGDLHKSHNEVKLKKPDSFECESNLIPDAPLSTSQNQVQNNPPTLVVTQRTKQQLKSPSILHVAKLSNGATKSKISNVNDSVEKKSPMQRNNKKKNMTYYRSFVWSEYLEMKKAVAAPPDCFKQSRELLVNEFECGMRLLARDPKARSCWCLATVMKKLGPRIQLRFESGGTSDDFWELIDSSSIRPYDGRFVQQPEPDVFGPPVSYTRNLSTYLTFVEKIVYGESPNLAPHECFKCEPPNPVRNMFQVGMRLEAIDRKNKGLVCVATVTSVCGDTLTIEFDGWKGGGFSCSYLSREIFPVGWSSHYGHPLEPPPDWGLSPGGISLADLSISSESSAQTSLNSSGLKSSFNDLESQKLKTLKTTNVKNCVSDTDHSTATLIDDERGRPQKSQSFEICQKKDIVDNYDVLKTTQDVAFDSYPPIESVTDVISVTNMNNKDHKADPAGIEVINIDDDVDYYANYVISHRSLPENKGKHSLSPHKKLPGQKKSKLKGPRCKLVQNGHSLSEGLVENSNNNSDRNDSNGNGKNLEHDSNLDMIAEPVISDSQKVEKMENNSSSLTANSNSTSQTNKQIITASSSSMENLCTSICDSPTKEKRKTKKKVKSLLFPLSEDGSITKKEKKKKKKDKIKKDKKVKGRIKIKFKGLKKSSKKLDRISQLASDSQESETFASASTPTAVDFSKKKLKNTLNLIDQHVPQDSRNSNFSMFELNKDTAAINLSDWSTNDLLNRLSTDETLRPHLKVFSDHEIDGRAYMKLTTDHMRTYLDLKLGPILKISTIMQPFVAQSLRAVDTKRDQQVVPDRLKSKPLSLWSVDDVVSALSSDETLRPHLKVFSDHEIDGRAFMEMTTEHMIKYLNLKLGSILKINTIMHPFVT